MHIALDATYLVDPHPSGISVYSRELLNGLAREHPADSYFHYYRPKQFRRSCPPAFPNVHRRLLLPVSWGRPAVFHALNQRVDQRLGKRVVSTFHDLFVMTGEYSSKDFRERFTRQAKCAAQRSDLIIAVSEFTRQQVITHLGVDAKRLRVVPHGVHLPLHVPSLDVREKIILCVGALQLRKNVIRLIEAFERLNSDWTLVLAGSTAGFGAAQILQRIERSRVSRQIQLPGYLTQQELNLLYSRAAIFAFPSLDEGFGIPVLEAMANGIPVVTSDRSALPQVAGDAALLIDPFDITALSGALDRLMQDRDLRRELTAKGLERARIFPWERAVKATYKIYQQLA